MKKECFVHLSVDDLVSAQRARLPEAFPAHFAHERPRAGVHGHVAGQVVVRVKHLQEKQTTTMAIIIIIIIRITQKL